MNRSIAGDLAITPIPAIFMMTVLRSLMRFEPSETNGKPEQASQKHRHLAAEFR